MQRTCTLALAAASAVCAISALLETSAAEHTAPQLVRERSSIDDEVLEQPDGRTESASHRGADSQWLRWRINPSSAATASDQDAQEAAERAHESSASVSVASLDHVHVQARWDLPRESVPGAGEDVLWELCAVRGDGGSTSVASGSVASQVVDLETVDGGAGDAEREAIRDGEALTESEDDASGLECELDPAFCVPELVAIRLPDMKREGSHEASGDADAPYVLDVSHSIELEFSQPTSRPRVATAEDIRAFLDISDYVGGVLTGSWSSDGRTLTLTVLEADAATARPARELLAALEGTRVIHKRRWQVPTGSLQPRGAQLRVSFSAELSFRVERPGTYFVRITGIPAPAVAATATRSFRSPAFVVHASDASHLILMDQSSATAGATACHTHYVELPISDDRPSGSDGAPDLSLTPPSLFVPGVLTHASGEGFVIPERFVQPPTASRAGSWSLSFWAFLYEDATGSFRSLFFHGDGAHEQRTPSAWWKPDERRLALRVSTAADPDVGLDSGRALPLRQWVHLGFSFRNCSDGARQPVDAACEAAASDAAAWFYVVELFVDGELDQRMRVHEPATRNLGPLHIGKGPWTPGMQGFTSDLRVFASPLSGEQHRRRFLLGKSSHPNFVALGRGEHELEAPAEVAKTPAAQIAYLVQRVMPRTLGSSTGAEGDARVLSAQCDERAWDRLNELAEQGDAAALASVGAALLFGEWIAADNASSCAPVAPSASEAASLLLRALQGGEERAARFLALALEVAGDGDLAGDEPVEAERALRPLHIGLYHVAAVAGSPEAFALLGNAYHRQGEALTAAAAHHYFHAARDASVAFHERGKQPLHEMDRLFDHADWEGRADLSARGQRGHDDELIRFQQARAEHGDADALAAMGDLYYWGARGVPRDHERARLFFERAAHAGNADAQCAVANMLLRGEGGAEQDPAAAVAWYERAAAAENHPRALNGLGFLHFHGSAGLAENKTRALELFERAARERRDGDSLYNAGYCYAKGLGTAGGRANLTRAVELFEVAARAFGHFDSVMELGEIWMRGAAVRYGGAGTTRALDEPVEDVDADWARALPFVKAAADAGRWGGRMRAGFSRFLAGDWTRALPHYHDAEAFGYPLATSNLAFLYDALLVRDGGGAAAASNLPRERRALEYLQRAHEQNGDREVLVRIGDFHFHGLADLPADPRQALAWYSRASARGDDRGAFNVGYMYEHGVGGVRANLPRARRYYERAAELAVAAGRGPLASIPARLALLRVAVREWLRGSPVLAAAVDRVGTLYTQGLASDDAGVRRDPERSATGLLVAAGLAIVAGGVLLVLAKRLMPFLRPN